MKTIDKEKKNEELKTIMLCNEVNCHGKARNYRIMKTLNAKNERIYRITEELLFKIETM